MEEVRIPVENAPYDNVPIYYSTGVFGGLEPHDAKIVFYIDRAIPQTDSESGRMSAENMLREFQAEMHLTPGAFKRIWLWMGRHIQRYETTFGEIVIEPRSQSTPEAPEEG